MGARFGKPDEKDLMSAVEEVMEFANLAEKKELMCHNLNVSEKKWVEITRALATRPKLLLLDEVIAGLNPVETENIMELIRKIRKEKKITVFMIEHVMKAIMNISDRIIVLHHGEKIAEGAPQSIIRDRKVIDVYLGERFI